MTIQQFFKRYIPVVLISMVYQTISAQIASDTVGCVPLLVSFTSPSDTLTQPVWDFQDGATSNKKDASHVFVQPGIYQVTLKNYNKIVVTRQITVYSRPDIQMTTDVSEGCAPMTVNFTDKTVMPAGITVKGWLWDFGDGDGSILQNPYHVYTTLDKFPVTLTIKTSIEQCNVTRKFDEYIITREKLDAGFSIDSISPSCTYPAYIHLTNRGKIDPSYLYVWKMGSDLFSSNAQPQPVRITKDSLYLVTLEVDNQKGCKAKLTAQVNVVFHPKIQILYEDTICANNLRTFTATGNATRFLWHFGPKSSTAYSSLNNPTVEFKEKGVFDVALSYTSISGCQKDTTLRVHVLKKDAGFTIEPNTICSLPAQIRCRANVGNYATYTWDNQPGGREHTIFIPGILRDTFYYHEPDSLAINLRISDGEGCYSDSTMKFRFELPNAQFEISEHEGVIPWTVYVKDISESTSPIVKWVISWGDGTVVEYDSISIKTASHEYIQQGRYYINMWIMNAEGCEDRHFGAWVDAHDMVDLNGLPVCHGTCKGGSCTGVGSITMCYKETFSATLDRYPSYIDALHFNMGPTLGNCDQTFLIPGMPMYNDPGSYPLTATLENGGNFYELAGPIVQVLGPKAVIDYQVSCDGSFAVRFTNKSLDYSHVLWNIAGTQRTQDQFTYTFPGRGDYPVTLIAYNDRGACQPDTARVLIRLRQPKARITADKEWCYNSPKPLIATGTTDEIVGCKMGYVWSFPTADKPPIVTDRDTVNTYLPPGKQMIVLTVRDVNGCMDRDTAEATSWYIEAGFTSDATKICSPLKVNFTDISKHDHDIVRYIWNVDPEKNTGNFSHVFEEIQDSVLYVTLEVRDSLGCSSLASKKFRTYTPEALITFAPIACEGVKMRFSATDTTETNTRLQYFWKLDNTEYSQDSAFEVPGFSPGNHTGRLRITEKSTRCTNETDFTFHIIKQPQAIISALEDSVFCYPKTIQLFGHQSIVDSLDKVSYKWTYSNGRSNAKVNPVETFEKGVYTIKLRVRSVYQCESVAEKKIRLVGPEGNFTMDKSLICKGESVKFTLTDAREVDQYFWDFGQGEVSNNTPGVNYQYNFYPASGATFASLVLYGQEKNCQIVQSKPIRFYQVHADFVPDTICGTSMQIAHTSLGAASATWSWGNQKLIKNDPTVNISVKEYGDYPLTLAIQGTQGNCRDTATAMIRFAKPPAIAIPAENYACLGDTLSFSYDPELSYQFTPPGSMEIQDNRIIWPAGGNQTIQIRATTADGCTDSKETRMNSRNVSVQTSGRPLYACEEDWQRNLGVDSSAGSLIFWSVPGTEISEVLSCIHCRQPNVLNDYAGPIHVTVVDKNTCITREIAMELFYPNVRVPNVFSPNGDGENDLFKPVVLDTKLEDVLVIHEIQVFNRWGKEIYHANKAWDGMTEGRPATAEVYYYTMTFSIGEACLTSVKGDVTLIR